MIDCTPEIVPLSVDLHNHLINVPAPTHMVHAAATNFSGEHRAETSPPLPHRFMTYVDPIAEQQVLNIPKAERVSNVQHHCHSDHLG